jgi:hypothetical protein
MMRRDYHTVERITCKNSFLSWIKSGTDELKKGKEHGVFFIFFYSRMMNIVRAEKKGNGYDPTIYHASLVETKYGYSAKFLTSLAWKCQSKHGGFEYDWATSLNHTTSTTTTSTTTSHESELRELAKAGDCYFNLPVCDLTRPGKLLLSHVCVLST